MANVDIRISSTFKFLNDMDLDSIENIKVVMIPDRGAPAHGRIAFVLDEENLKEGTMSLQKDGPEKTIKIDAVFSLSVKSNYVDDVKSNEHTWLFDQINGEYEDYEIEGLELIVHQYFNNRTKKDVVENYFVLPVKSV